jgi:hypothetical protein
MRKISLIFSLLSFVVCAPQRIFGQPDSISAISQALTAKYALTTPTADKTNVVKAGTVLVLKKNNLATIAGGATFPVSNTYKNGEIAQGMMAHLSSGTTGTRTFVAGEKLWVTNIDVKSKGITFSLFSDAFAGTHYQSSLIFPFAKGSTPSVADALAEVSEVFDLENAGKGPVEAPASAAGPQSSGGGSNDVASAPPAPVIDNTPWNSKNGRLTAAELKRIGDPGVRYDLAYIRMNPAILDNKPVMQYFIGLNNCNDQSIQRAIFNELDYPALAAFYKQKAPQILGSLPRTITNLELYRFIGGQQGGGWHMWSQSLSLGEYDSQRRAFPLKYPGKNNVEIPEGLTANLDRRNFSQACPTAGRTLAAAQKFFPNVYSISLKPATYSELSMDEASARRYIESANQQRSVYLALDVTVLDTPPVISHPNPASTEATFHVQIARVQVMDAVTYKPVGVLFDDHSQAEVQVAQAPPPPPAADKPAGDQWAAGDHLYEIRQAVYISLSASACSNWPLTPEQRANLKKFLDEVSNGKFNDKYQYNMSDARIRNAINAKGRANFCADPNERRDFDKAAATVAPLGPIAAPHAQQGK